MISTAHLFLPSQKGACNVVGFPERWQSARPEHGILTVQARHEPRVLHDAVEQLLKSEEGVGLLMLSAHATRLKNS